MRKVCRPVQRYFPYFGSKYTLAKRYPKPQHDTIVEPFAGAAGYSTNYAEKRVVIGDVDLRIVGIWQYLINATYEDIIKLPLLERDGSVATLPACQEARWLIGMWVGHAHTPRLNPSGWFRKGKGRKAYWGAYIRRRLAEQIHCINHWICYQSSYRDLPKQNRTATWFIDPTYQKAGKLYCRNDLDFKHLGKWCKSRRGQVIVCENEGADWLPFRALKRVHGAYLDARRKKATRGGHRGKVEAYWLSDGKYHSEATGFIK